MAIATLVHLTIRDGCEQIVSKLAGEVEAGHSVTVVVPNGQALDRLMAVQMERGWEVVGSVHLLRPEPRSSRRPAGPGSDHNRRGLVVVRLPDPPFPSGWSGERIEEDGDVRVIACTPGAGSDRDARVAAASPSPGMDTGVIVDVESRLTPRPRHRVETQPHSATPAVHEDRDKAMRASRGP
jgi:hypothetical protein